MSVPIRSTAAVSRPRQLATRLSCGIAVAAVSSVLALPAHAQQLGSPARVGPVVHVAPYAGFLMTGNIASGPLGSNLTSANGPIVGAQLGVDLTRNISVVGNLGYARSDLRVGVPILGGINVGQSTMWVYDGALQLGVPIQTAGGLGLRPFVQGGVGGITQRLDNRIMDSRGSNVAYNIGAGVDVNITRAIGLQLMVKDYIGRFNSQDAIGFDLGGGTTHNVALTAGLRLAF